MTWWSRRFLEALDGLGLGGYRGSGQRSARAGHVLSLSVSTSLVTALVRDSGPDPHRTRIAVKAFESADWARIEQELASQAVFAAKLLAGELPADLEGVFTKLGLSLFPRTLREITMDCSCPGWEVPCRHLAAACQVLADSFDADPFTYLAWRGRTREDLLDRLRALRIHAADRETGPPTLADQLDSFWGERTEVAVTGGATAPVLDQLDPMGSVTDLLRPAYRAMTSRPRAEGGQ
ncbi:SWIM zinc finger family protein [Amycolatopsis magusensis]|uniref:Zn finger protein n=1 Tax=Amycolatopsis magusensis TaxID=882444 RepID=A0ABS4Q325_9PSEU|nr:SWIM zinc finger family protein [Amycolatopsis magusensis]MBP2186089.1 putative Zn finger protein [Amycolatopsis magusensis]MDI5979949.1 SWIM zinc finger family protein [Amycolatopsis magusensis]